MLRLSIFLGLLSPFLYLLYGALTNNLGADPADSLIDVTALTAMFMLFAILLLPVPKKLGLNLLPYRRMLGLYVFFYASLHIITVTIYEFGASLNVFLSETIDKPFVWLGVLAWVLLLPLAITSTNGWRRRLKLRWRSLHQLVYIAFLAVAIHYGMQLRGDLLAYAWLVPLTVGILAWKANRFIKEKKRKSGRVKKT